MTTRTLDEIGDAMVAALAGADSDVQAAFFNRFFQRLCANEHSSAASRGEPNQLDHITRDLDGVARKAVEYWATCTTYEAEQDAARRAAYAPAREEMYEVERKVRALQAQREELEREIAAARNGGAS